MKQRLTAYLQMLEGTAEQAQDENLDYQRKLLEKYLPRHSGLLVVAVSLELSK